MGSDLVLNKIASIERCIQRVYEEYEGSPESLRNYTKQDSIVLNIQRACEMCIDLSMHMISEKKLGIPQNSRAAFELLEENGYISSELALKMRAMVGFRNIAVHNYKELNLAIVQGIVEEHLQDFILFTQTIRHQYEV
ncbi:MAG: type VII toxin-antitoxin system HepT family RNase toxin [Bacilli bacterium]